MQIIPLSAITIAPNRQRRNFDDTKLKELIESIQTKGLFHPIVVRYGEGGVITLVAGERRMRALTLMAESGTPIHFNGEALNAGHCPTVLITELDALGYEEAELEENIRRVDLSVAELATAYHRLHNLRVMQARSRGEQHTVADTAREAAGDPSLPAASTAAQNASKYLIVAKHLDDPLVAKAKNLTEAMRAVEKKVQTTAYIAKSRQASSNPTTHTLLKGDAHALLAGLPAESFDCIISDPPYGVGADSFGDQAGAAHSYRDTPEASSAAYELLARDGYRLARAQAHLFVFCDIRRFFELSLDFGIEGWTVWQTPLIWAKGGGMLPIPGLGPRRSYEAILFASKGMKRVQQTLDDLISVPGINDPRRGAEKPAELFRKLLSMVSMPGDRVLDPFMGTGPILEAATRLSLVATGIELDEAAYGMAVERTGIRATIFDI